MDGRRRDAGAGRAGHHQPPLSVPIPERRHGPAFLQEGSALRLFALAILAVVLGAGTAKAAGKPLSDAVTVSRGATCVEAALLVEQVTAWLGPGGVDAALRVEVTGDAADPQRVEFRLYRENTVIAERRFARAPARCDHLHAVVGLAIALALKAQVLDDILGEPLRLAPPVHRVGVEAGFLAAWNVVPGFALGGAARLDYQLGRNFTLRAGAFGVGGWPQMLDDGPGTFTSSLLALEVGACVGLFRAGPAGANACVGLAGGALEARGNGFEQSRTSHLSWFAVSNSLGFSVVLGQRWSLGLTTSLVLPLQATRFSVRSSLGFQVADREPDPLGIRVELGPHYDF